MNWISVKDQRIPTDKFVLVTDGKSIGLPGALDSPFHYKKLVYYSNKNAYYNEPLDKATHWIYIKDIQLPK